MTKSTKRSADTPDGEPATGATGRPRSKPPRGVTVRVVYDPDREARIEALIAILDSATPPPPSPLLTAAQMLRAETARHRAEKASGDLPDDDGEAGR